MPNPSSRWLRALALAVAVCGLGVTGMLLAHRSAEPLWGNLSLPALLALGMVVLFSVGAIGLALLPTRVLDRLVERIAVWREQLAKAPVRGPRWIGLVLCGVALAAYGVLVVRFAQQNTVASADQSEYLRVAGEIKQNGGLPQLWRDLWAGRFREANRHPLYLALLSLHPQFVWGKWLSALLGAAALAVLATVSGRRNGWLVAGVAAVLLATNHAFLRASSSVACETLLVLWTASAWAAVHGAGAVGHDPRVSPRPQRKRLPTLLYVGMWLGLAYLTKASGFLLLVGAVVWTAAERTLRRTAWLVVVGFVLVSLPLLVRNGRAFGNPLYSFNTRFLFEDSFAAGLRRPPEPTFGAARRYLAEHSARDVASRLARGLGWESYVLLRVLSPASWGRASALIGAVVATGALVGLATTRAGSQLAVLWTILFLLFFGWYVPIASGDRFLQPLLPCLLHCAALGCVRTWCTGDTSEHSRRAGWVLLFGCSWAALATGLGWQQTDGVEFS